MNLTRPRFRAAIFSAALNALFLAAMLPAAPAPEGTYRAGAAKVDITPVDYPVRVNGGFLEKTATKAVDRLQARALVIAKNTAKARFSSKGGMLCASFTPQGVAMMDVGAISAKPIRLT